MSDFKVKQKDGSDTTFTEETFNESKEVLVQLGAIVGKMKDNLATKQLVDSILFAKMNGLRSDEMLLLAIDGLHQNLLRVKELMRQKEELKQMTETLQEEDIPKDLN